MPKKNVPTARWVANLRRAVAALETIQNDPGAPGERAVREPLAAAKTRALDALNAAERLREEAE